MDCPKCVGKLEKKKITNLEADACPICEGLWFDAGELEAVIKADSTEGLDYIDVGKEEYDGAEATAAGLNLDEKKGKCPRCDDGTVLVQTEYEKKETVKIDMCPKGHGIWLDGGEVQKLRVKSYSYWLKLIRYSFSKDGLRELWDNAFRS